MNLDHPIPRHRRKGQIREDRISHLPDGILVYILSLMPTKYSIRTSVLSKRWEHLWTFSPKLDFEIQLPFVNKDTYGDEHMQLCADTFTRSVNSTLFRIRGNSSMESFCIYCWALIDNSLPNTWIRNVLMCKNLTELIIEVEHTVRLGELPDSLFTCKTLVVVKIFGRFTLNLPYHTRLPNLKTLSLVYVRQFSDRSIQNLLLGCPILEDFHIIRYPSDYTLIMDVRLPLLRSLSLGLGGQDFKKDDYSYDIKVEAPILEFIEVMNYNVQDVSLDISSQSIVEACFDFYSFSVACEVEYRNHAIVLLRRFASVMRLYLSQESCQILFCSNETKLPMFLNLIQLEIDFNLKGGPQHLMDLLDRCPKLELLNLLQDILSPSEIEDYSEFEDDSYFYHWTQPVQVPGCLLHNLKRVRLHEYGGEPEEIATVTYLLKNALILEKMTIFCRNSIDSENVVELDRSLAAYPKVSAGCQVKLYPESGE